MSYFEFIGPSDKFLSSGMSPAEFAAKQRKHKYAREDHLELDKPTDDALSGTKRELKDDPNAVKVSSLIKAAFMEGSSKYLLTDLLQDGMDFWSSPSQELMPKDMTQAGRMRKPEYFFHGGFDEVSGSTSPSVAAEAKNHGQGPDAGVDSYENYAQEKDMKDAIRQLQIRKKTASILVKAGMSPPLVAGSNPDIPNDELDVNTDPDLKRRTASAESGKPGFYPKPSFNTRLVRIRNANHAVKQAVAFSFGPGQGGYNSSSSGPSSVLPPVDKSTKKPRRAGMQVEFARSQTAPFQGQKIPSGYPSDDKQTQNAKTAALIYLGFPWD